MQETLTYPLKFLYIKNLAYILFFNEIIKISFKSINNNWLIK